MAAEKERVRVMRVSILRKHGHEVVDINRRKAIRERCLNCSGWHSNDVRDCEFDDCPLHSFRTGRGKQNAPARSKMIRKYCLWCCNGQLMLVSKCPSTDCPLFPYRKSTTDKSVKVGATSKTGHIEAPQRSKIENTLLTSRLFLN
jgi:hypothetical protein